MTNHVTEKQLIRYCSAESNAAENTLVKEHLSVCSDCRTDLKVVEMGHESLREHNFIIEYTSHAKEIMETIFSERVILSDHKRFFRIVAVLMFFLVTTSFLSFGLLLRKSILVGLDKNGAYSSWIHESLLSVKSSLLIVKMDGMAFISTVLVFTIGCVYLILAERRGLKNYTKQW